VLSYRVDRLAAESVAADVAAAGASAVTVACDVANEADVLALFAAADEAGTVRALVNNAGILDQRGRLDTFSAERIERVVAVNVTGALLCAREAVRRMSTAHGGGGGVIVNVSSRASVLGSATEYIDYAATKGAVDTLTVGLANEVGREGIRVNAVRPGLIETDIHASGGMPDRVARFADRVPMGRGGTAEEVAASICWLLSDDAAYVTGALLDVSGGR
jgi:NAD(P)-dependent dehydrogenase (short-subunit alcohol dehydrogenase family)